MARCGTARVACTQGEGSFGQVFLGSYAAGGEEKVVLKRVKATVEVWPFAPARSGRAGQGVHTH